VTQSRQPIFNVPGVVVAVLALILALHLVRLFLLSPKTELEFLFLLAFIPARYDAALLIGGTMPGGLAADIWTFVTYSLIHTDFMHLGFNSIWLLAFGTPVARRFGAWRFLLFFAVTAAAGAAAHLLTHARELQPMVGASASVSGCMAAAMRFAFQRGGPIWARGDDPAIYRLPALPLREVLRDRRCRDLHRRLVRIEFPVRDRLALDHGLRAVHCLAGACRRVRRRAAVVRMVRSGVSAKRRRCSGFR
jgi:membrane associated rhomboid family serine protease